MDFTLIQTCVSPLEMIALSIGLWLTVPYQMYLGIIIEWPSMNRLQVSRKNESSAEKLAESYLAGLAGACYKALADSKRRK